MSVGFEFIEGEPERSPGAGRPHQYDDMIEALKDNPGQWAKVDKVWKTSPSLLGAVKHGRSGFVPVGAFEARSRKAEGGFEAFVRYVGEV